jgi:hypothetical protein
MNSKHPLLASILLVSIGFGSHQCNAENLTLAGWGVRIQHPSPTGVVGQNTAFQFSPDGSFYEVVQSSVFTLKIGAQIKALNNLTGVKIPIDAFCQVQVLVDNAVVADFVNQHKDVLVNLTAGVHNILIVNNCGSVTNGWAGMTLGKTLWGANELIKFVSTYMN